jgi:hypothetical protein
MRNIFRKNHRALRIVAVAALVLTGFSVGFSATSMASWMTSRTIDIDTVTSGQFDLEQVCGKQSCTSYSVYSGSKVLADDSAKPGGDSAVDPVCGPNTSQVYREKLQISANSDDPQDSNMIARLAVFDSAAAVRIQGSDIDVHTVELFSPVGTTLGKFDISAITTQSAAPGYDADSQSVTSLAGYPVTWLLKGDPSGVYTVEWRFHANCDQWHPEQTRVNLPDRVWMLRQER